MPFYIISIILQVALVLHIIKTGRSKTWIWIVVMLPLAGSVAYLIVEVLPGLTGSRTGRQAKSKITNIINPNKNINQAAHNYTIVDSVENSIMLAEECINKNMLEEAKQIYQQGLQGANKYEPLLMHGLAKTEFELTNFSSAKTVLDQLIEKNPDYKNPDAHLLYAKTLETLNEIDLALLEYETLNDYYPGPQATYRYAMLLKQKGHARQAKELIKEIVHAASITGKHYNKLYKEWVNKAKNELNG